MAKILGTSERLVVSDKLDSDGEINITMAIYASDSGHTDDWLNRDMAKELIEHLSKVFKL